MPETIKIYPSTQEQVAAIDAKLDIINGKLPLPQYQIKTVTPSNVQQTVTPDNNYAGLSGVVVNPISALMPENLEDYILRKDTMPEFTLSLSGNVPRYACYGQTNLKAVYGRVLSIGESAFEGCTSLQNFLSNDFITVNKNSFYGCSALSSLDCRNLIGTIPTGAFSNCTNLHTLDCRNVTTFDDGCAQNNPNLYYIDARNTQSFVGWVFNKCPHIHLLDITNSHSAKLAWPSQALPDNNSLRIVVADATDKAYYQSATNWSVYASKIKTVAEFEQEIGMTYDEYYLQVFGHARNEVAA